MIVNNSNTNVKTQVGIVSSGGGNGGTGDGCGAGGEYSRVSLYLDWIISTLHLNGTPDFVCNNTTFENLGIMPDGMSFEWTASPTSLFSVSAGTGLSFTTSQSPNNSGVGSITLKAKSASGNVIVTVTKQVWVGTPKINLVTDGTFSINGQFASICKGFGYCMTANSDVILTIVFDTPEKLESIPDLIEIKAEKTGQTLKYKEMKGFKENGKSDAKALSKLDIDVSDLPRGTYYVHLTFGTNKEQKIEKARIILTN